MDVNGLKKYLPSAEGEVSQLTLLIEQANACESVHDILFNHFKIFIPEGGSGSVKLKCPYSLEHKDGGKEKAMRYYYETDSAYCFRDHGVLSPTFLWASEWGVSEAAAARRILDRAGVGKRESWRTRIENIINSPETASSASVSSALTALAMRYRDIDGYVSLQYRPAVLQEKLRVSEMFNPMWDFESVEKWLDYSTEKMKEVINGET